ncbi:MAG: LPS assembly protein LptD [Akkermansiaceae bacterium]|nr:LPS assembly protein LptD [Akkermansiaceae bacterium]
MDSTGDRNYFMIPCGILLLYSTPPHPVDFAAMLTARFISTFRLLPLLPITIMAQDEGMLSPIEPIPVPVELIQPVPAPEIPFGGVQDAPVIPENLKIENGGGVIEGNPEEGITLGGPIKVSGDNGLEIFSDRARLDLKEKTVTFNGNVSIYQGNNLQRGDSAVYYYEKRVLDASALRVSLDPIILEAGKFTAQSNGGQTVFVGENAGVTTHDVENPNYWVRSDRTTVYPGDRVTFHNLKLYAGDTPIFWLPYLSQPLDSELGYHFVPGARSHWGPYLLNTYGIMLGGTPNPVTGEKEGAWLLSRWRFDIRASRGVAVGLDLVDTREENSKEITGLSLYYLNDADPSESRDGFPRNSIDPNRYKVQLKNRVEFDIENDADWRLDTNLTLLSDEYYLEDFDPRNYRTDPSPDNTIGLFRNDGDSLLSIYGRFRLNDFYRADTQSPEIAFDQVRRPLFGSPLLHEGQTSFSFRGVEVADLTRRNIINPLLTLPVNDPLIPGLLSQLNGYERTLVQRINALRAINPADPRIASIRAQLLETGYNRFHTNQNFSLPLTHDDWFTFTPRIGAAYTHYSSVQGPENNDARFILHGGAEAAVKFSKRYGTQNHDLGLDGLMHVIQPYANWSVVAADELNQDYPRIDRLTFTTRPRPLDPSRYTAIDELDSWNILRLGVRNQLITRRDGQSHDWLFVDTYVDKYFDDPEGEREWSNLYNDFRWQPLPWLGLDLETQIPILGGGSGFSELSTRVRYQPYSDMEISLAYRHLNNHPVLLDSDRIELATYLRLSENWGIGTSHVFEMDDGTLEIQQYTVHRDFGNFVAGVGISHRDNRFEDEFGIIFSLTLKNFPSASLPFTLDAE